MFCALLGHTGERLQDHWSSGSDCQSTLKVNTVWTMFYE